MQKMTRRTFLKTVGAATLALATGGGAWRAVDQGVFAVGAGPAYTPWDAWKGTPAEGALALVRAAVLAANPDNSQPWLFRLGPLRVDVFADPSRRLAAVDPFGRNVSIALGCAVENMTLAAQAHGFAPDVTLLPDPADPLHAACVVLTLSDSVLSDSAPSDGATSVRDLYEAIPRRHMNRAAYDTARLPETATLDALAALGAEMADVRVFWFTGADERRRVGALIVQATEAVIQDAGQAADVTAWTRNTREEIQRRRDGITLEAAGLSPVVLALAKMLPPLSPEQNHRAWLKTTRETQVPTAGAFGIVAVRDKNDRAQQLRAGRLWQRMHLWGTVAGLGMHILHQLPDRAGREESLGIAPQFGEALQTLINAPDWQPLSMFRLGYPTRAALCSPRRAIADVLLDDSANG